MHLKSLFLILLSALLMADMHGQNNPLIVPDNIIYPRDTTVRKQLITALNGFLTATAKSNADNAFVQPSELLETAVLLDEMKDLNKDANSKEHNFHKPYLTNVIRFNDSLFLIQLSYIGVKTDTPSLRASFTLLADKRGSQFYFKSPLKQNTANWKVQKIGFLNIYYKSTLNQLNAGTYFKVIADYDKKLSAPSLPTDFYCADDFHEVMQLIGMDYKSDYIGYAHVSESAKEDNRYLTVNGVLTSDFTKFDPHDLWHDRLHKVLSPELINKPVDEGTAYLYGGSWGLSWKDILNKFKIYAAANPNADWLALYNASENFDAAAKFPLNVDFAINALIVQKIEKEKGFSLVMELLRCGKKGTGNDNYFQALEKITGITRSTFNEQVKLLLQES
jgi:hypothetical protein